MVKHLDRRPETSRWWFRWSPHPGCARTLNVLGQAGNMFSSPDGVRHMGTAQGPGDQTKPNQKQHKNHTQSKQAEDDGGVTWPNRAEPGTRVGGVGGGGLDFYRT